MKFLDEQQTESKYSNNLRNGGGESANYLRFNGYGYNENQNDNSNIMSISDNNFQNTNYLEN